MTPYNEIRKLIEAIIAKQQSRSDMERTAHCFLKLVIAHTGKKFSMSDLIKMTNPNMTEIAPMLSVSQMTPAKLAHIIIGGAMLIMINGQYITLQELEELCEKAKDGSSTLRIDSPDENSWKPFSL